MKRLTSPGQTVPTSKAASMQQTADATEQGDVEDGTVEATGGAGVVYVVVSFHDPVFCSC